MLRISPNNQLADRIAKGGEFLLILCHDIAMIHCIVMVEVIGAAPHMEGGRDIDLRDGEVEEQPVICLEFDRAVFCQDSVITGEELPGGKPPSGMPCLGPGIGEVQIDAVNLSRSEDAGNIAGIHADEADVRQGRSIWQSGAGRGRLGDERLEFLHGPEEDAGVAFDPDIIDLRILPGEGKQELAFPHPDLYMDRMRIAEDLMPSAAVSALILNNFFTLVQHAYGARNISKAHT